MTDFCKIETRFEISDVLEAWIALCRAQHFDRLDDLFVLERWLKISGVPDGLAYPCIISLNEKPDFIFNTQSDKIGVEVTRLFSEQSGRAAKIAHQEKYGYCLTQFDFDSPKRNNTQIRNLIKTSARTGPLRDVSYLLDMYATQTVNIIYSKTKKAIFESDDGLFKTWLVVEDRQFLSSHDFPVFSAMIHQRLENYWDFGRMFDAIFFVSLVAKSCLTFKKSCPVGCRIYDV